MEKKRYLKWDRPHERLFSLQFVQYQSPGKTQQLKQDLCIRTLLFGHVLGMCPPPIIGIKTSRYKTFKRGVECSIIKSLSKGSPNSDLVPEGTFIVYLVLLFNRESAISM